MAILFAKVADVKEGSVLVTDEGFTCCDNHEEKTVKADGKGDLYIDCRDGQHYLDGQISGKFYTGLWPKT